MIVAATLLVRDEEDIIGPVLHNLRENGIEHILAADNMSEDGTRGILELYGCDIHDDTNPVHDHASKATMLAHMAHERYGAEWILPVDADEVWYWTDGTLAEFFAQCEADIVQATGWDHLVTDDDSPTEPNVVKRITHRRQAPQKLAKVAYRWHPNIECHMGNHDVTRPGVKVAGLNYRHFQYRSYEQMVRKVRQGAAAMGDLNETYCAHWRQAAHLDDEQLWRAWRRRCEEPGLIEDPCPYR